MNIRNEWVDSPGQMGIFRGSTKASSFIRFPLKQSLKCKTLAFYSRSRTFHTFDVEKKTECQAEKG